MRAAICGHFGFGKNLLNGQTVKTKILSKELKLQLGANEIWEIDTHGMCNALLMFPRLVWALVRCKNVIILPAHRGLKLVAYWLKIWNKLFQRRLHYVVIGGWVASYLEKHNLTASALHSFHGIYVETTTMKHALEKMGYTNVTVLPNCKQLDILQATEFPKEYTTPYRLCTFSRVTKEKGIGDAVDVVKKINSDFGRIVYTLDIYGNIDAGQADWFADLQANFPEYISYKGCVDFDKSVETLKDYFALLFPTCYYTEGIPGTIIDAYAAGLPVISSRWENFTDVVKDNHTGYGFEFKNWEELKTVLILAHNTPNVILDLKNNCVAEAKKYLPERVIKTLIDNL